MFFNNNSYLIIHFPDTLWFIGYECSQIYLLNTYCVLGSELNAYDVIPISNCLSSSNESRPHPQGTFPWATNYETSQVKKK